MRLTKRDRALTRIDISPVQSIYFQGKRYTYKQYLKIRRKNTAASSDDEKAARNNYTKLSKTRSSKQMVDNVIENFNEWKKSRQS